MSEEGFSKREWQNAYRESQAKLTAAQSRVVELERVLASAGDYQKWQHEIQRLQHDITERESMIQSMTMRIEQLVDVEKDNARLRESIQSVLAYANLPQRYRDELEAAIWKPTK